MRPSVTWTVSVIQCNKHNTRGLQNMRPLFAQKMFWKYNLSLLRHHTVYWSFFMFYGIIRSYNLVIQQYFQRNLLFVNNGVILTSTSPPLSVRYMCTEVLPSCESTICVALLWFEISQPSFKPCVSIPRPAMLCYSVRGHVCKLCIHYKNFKIILAVRCTTYCYLSTCGPRTSPQ